MYAALFDGDGVAKIIMDAPDGAVIRTADHYGFEHREIDRTIKAIEDVPHLSTFPPRD